jgi:hypothetical protein
VSAGLLDRRLQVLGEDNVVRQQDGAVEDVLQLADVSRPGLRS